MEEIDEVTYRDVPYPEYKGLYVMNGFGVKSLPRWVDTILSGKLYRYLRPERVMTMGMWGDYPAVGLTKESKQKRFFFHRMKAELYLEKVEGKNQVNHKNGVKTDFSLSNLEWCTAKENTRHAFDNGLNFVPSGEKHPNAKGVAQFTKDGVFVASFGCARDAMKATGIHYKSISNTARGQQKTTSGFIWKFT